jgi:hypothetical protein
MPAPAAPGNSRAVPYEEPEELQRAIVSRHAVRVHLALILTACFAAGLVVSRLMLIAGVGAMWLRYPIALTAAYATFLLGIRLWLAYAGYGESLAASSRNTASGSSDSWVPNIGAGLGNEAADVPAFRGGGGSSGGAGASMNFGESASGPAAPMPVTGMLSGSGTGGGKGGGGSFDLGDDGWVLIALIALLTAVFGAAFYLIYMAPTILGDAAFAAVLSGGLIRSTRRIGTGGWVGSVVRDTWWPFAIVFVLSLAFALTAQHYYPDALTLRDVLRHL